jgi:predicted NodU family carbamoyl transferase
LDAGKIMGLAPYGEFNPNIPKLFKNGRGNRDIFIPYYPMGAYIDNQNNPIFSHDFERDQEWHTDPSKLTK